MLFKQDKEVFVVPKGVQDIIPVNRIWQDGIFQVGKNKFSKCFRFTDINYAVASRADKEAMFLEYSELLNSFDTGATTKITILNRRLNKVDFEKSNNVKLQPLDPITTQDYLKTVSDIENSLVDPDADTYDFSEAERRGKYMRDPMYDGIIGLASNVDNTSDKKRFSNRLKKSKSQQKEKTQKEKKEKVDPKSTKNLIFLHGEDKQTAKARFKFDINGKEVQQNDKGNQVDGFGQVEQVKNSEFGNLPPLDEIRVPDLTGSGYSIHSEYMY